MKSGQPSIPCFDPTKSTQLPSFEIKPLGSRLPASAHPVAQGIDLSGRPKIIMAAGRGKTGKTTMLRWMAERGLSKGSRFLMADIDPTNASFSAYFPDTVRPDSIEPLAVRRWLQEFLQFALSERMTALIDLGGGDTALRSIVAEMPAFNDMIEDAGHAVAIFYLVGHQPEDMTPIATMADLGFNPAARAIVLNEGTAPIGLPRDRAFARVVSHPLFVDQISTGAVSLWMPRLLAADAVEARQASFFAARDGKTSHPIGLFDRSRVLHWLDSMDEQFGGVVSWMP